MNLKKNTLKNSKNISLNNKYLEIKGGQLLQGNIQISGAKNSVLVLMAASILSKGQINLFNVPQISDVLIMSKILSTIGMSIESNEDQLKISTKEICPPSENLLFDLFRALRVSFFA